MSNFWQKLKKNNKPFFVLAPMDDVTDVVFRQLICTTAKPDVLFTEFTNVDGLNSKGQDKLMPRLLFEPNEHPIVAQIWGQNPENYFKTAQMLVEMGFDGIDINMGCPVSKVVRSGSCGGLIREPERAKEIILATREGAAEKIPVSVKTRIGDKEIATEEWIGFLLSLKLDALTVHGRTVKEQSKVPAHWDEIAKAVALRDKSQESSVNPDPDKVGTGLIGVKETVIIGNGDVISYQDGLVKAKTSGVDGIMIGRGVFQNIFVFDPAKTNADLSVQERMDLLTRHTQMFVARWGNTKNFNILKKFFKIYASDFEGASELRVNLMETKNLEEVESVIHNFNHG
ncbi:hypothetical protein A2631_06000 [Candidatus Daviesbacteria bacterium RIFCSPHIGHO2_01_FULL_44_29]|uniref:tRNA-dihydrouridine synthase n=1 Tax=Candidatus Daviesbacteria bacterium RIFCSPHIGHO2_02_FULL_43_12 TaxID=1797776 RepID=A0A1F5KJ77_9BACT|nr:MAG: hypothetical protein A2631_06000 [Candidatus Daviesbacteria bacterium RIFCSPHIGHO2_01_FULL_44_29]OGE39145.1 MAG: hypothetical protein A3E86_03330 [Candidatus Daviesbacteria bacterium RIFCSPHIGHO2_12_FULL_47_45]OGE40948.1 MAG: hypothetical protein A3D25_02830 [Candidatus Daviesbacteria bacterium RIFCSPHIGHO2_02_FULL_43_12]OGE69901.1 MAG: hypothetical protein A3B55_05840 [Candidatus Daviesbacteria bacterium RIFCSPLOWO2_01_FULL_43_15]